MSPATAMAAPASSDETAMRKKRKSSVRRPSAFAVSSPSIRMFILDGRKAQMKMPTAA